MFVMYLGNGSGDDEYGRAYVAVHARRRGPPHMAEGCTSFFHYPREPAYTH